MSVENHIYVKIKNGLGNEMFQYAIGRKLAILNSCTLKMDISEFRENGMINHELVTYNLDKFNIVAEIASNEEIEQFKEIRKRTFNNRLIRAAYNRAWKQYHAISFYKKPYIRDIWNGDMRVLKAKAPCCLEGDWADYKYTDDIRDLLVKELSLKEDLRNRRFKQIQQQLQESPQSIAIHMRRNYLKLPEASVVFGVKPLSYFTEAIDTIRKVHKEVTLFVFADDINWAKENFRYELPVTFIDHYPELNDAHDLELMKNCNHNIISNSTFSWWAAYLNDNPGKMVIAPQKWYLSHYYQSFYEKHKNFTPPGWILK